MRRDRGSGVRVLALYPGPVATGYFASLGDPAATSIIYRRTASPADVVKAALRGQFGVLGPGRARAGEHVRRPSARVIEGVSTTVVGPAMVTG